MAGNVSGSGAGILCESDPPVVSRRGSGKGSFFDTGQGLLTGTLRSMSQPEDPYQPPQGAVANLSSVGMSTTRAVGLALLSYFAGMLAVSLPQLFVAEDASSAFLRLIGLGYVVPGPVAGWIAERRSRARWPVASGSTAAVMSLIYLLGGLAMLNGTRVLAILSGFLILQALITIGAGWLAARGR